MRYSQTVLVVWRGAALSLPSCRSPSTLLPPGCAAAPQTRARCSPPSWKEWSKAALLVRATFLLAAVLHNLKLQEVWANAAILILCHQQKSTRRIKTHSPPMIFKEPTDCSLLESRFCPSADVPPSLSQKLKMSLSISKQGPSKPGLSYTTACDRGRTGRSLYPTHWHCWSKDNKTCFVFFCFFVFVQIH